MSTSGCSIFHATLVKENSKAGKFEDVINQLSAQVNKKGIDKLKICIGQNTYKETDMGSEFSEYLSEELSIAIVKSDILKEISRKELDQILREQKLSLSGLIDNTEDFEVGKIQSIDAILTGTYWEEENDVKVNLSLIKVITGEKLAAVSFVISENEIPNGVNLLPKNYSNYYTSSKIWGENKGTSKDLKVRVWVDKGNGSVYKNGENVTIFFMSDKNCYLRLYHTNVEGEIQLLFPNYYSRSDYIQAKQLYSIPNDEMAFEFKIVPPFGVEIINAVVSTKPFPIENFSTSEEQVFYPLGKVTENNLRLLISRGIAIVPINMRTEDTCVFTTIEKLRQ